MILKPGNTKELAVGIKKVLDGADFANKLSEQAYRDVQNYTWNNRAKKILSLLCT